MPGSNHQDIHANGAFASERDSLPPEASPGASAKPSAAREGISELLASAIQETLGTASDSLGTASRSGRPLGGLEQALLEVARDHGHETEPTLDVVQAMVRQALGRMANRARFDRAHIVEQTAQTLLEHPPTRQRLQRLWLNLKQRSEVDASAGSDAASGGSHSGGAP